jgi:hypothetical protein
MSELEKLIDLQEQLITFWKNQSIDLSMMSKIEFGEAVIEEGLRLK